MFSAGEAIKEEYVFMEGVLCHTIRIEKYLLEPKDSNTNLITWHKLDGTPAER